MKVLLTGGAGYLGSVLCEHLLAAGHEVVVIDNFMFGQTSLFHLCANKKFEIVKGDARDMSVVGQELKKVDAVIPLAALVGAPLCDREPISAISINYEAIRDLNKLRSGNQLIVYPTTNSGYGTQTGDAFCTEETPLEPISIYGKTKVDAEKEILDSNNSISLRLATVFGCSPRMRIDLLVNHFTYAAATDGYIVIFEKDFKRNYIHIRDVADCFLYCLSNAQRMAGKPYNLGLDAANLSKEELALKVKEHVPKFYIHFSEVGSDPDKRNYIVSNKRLKDAGFEAKRNLDQGITELLKAYRMVRKTQFGNV
jgi:nucleoside-diphosphate-sugar epimerase